MKNIFLEMKYLKKFNEELNPQTYRNAARKLKKLGSFNNKRANELENWANTKEQEQNSIKWEEYIRDYSKFGKVKLSISSENGEGVGEFYLALDFIPDAFEDNLDQESGNIIIDSILIPIDKKTKDMCDKIMPMPEEFMGGYPFGITMVIEMSFENDSYVFENLTLTVGDTGTIGNITIADRRSMNIVKNTFKNIFLKKSEGGIGDEYPSGYNNFNNMYDLLEATILIQCGLSGDYGLSMKAIYDYINKIPVNGFNIEN